MKNKEFIGVFGASQNNLKKINIEIPKHKLVVITGVSGSGKSSLAFDTIYAEGFRRYAESLSSSARFFLGEIKKPNIRRIENLSPAVALTQKTTAVNPRSTVGTLTENYRFLRKLMAEFGEPFCPKCKIKLIKQDEQELIEKIKELKNKTVLKVLAVWDKKQKDTYKKIKAIANHGYARVRIAEKNYLVERALKEKFKNGIKVEVVVDHMVLQRNRFDKERFIDSLRVAANLSKGQASLLIDDKRRLIFSQNFFCVQCGFRLGELSPGNFSFNSPKGACQRCSGLGKVYLADINKIIPNQKISFNEGAIRPWSQIKVNRGRKKTEQELILKKLAKQYKFQLNQPVKNISSNTLEKIFFGDKDNPLWLSKKEGFSEERYFKGIGKELERRWQENSSGLTQREMEKYLTEKTCPNCQGNRLRVEYLRIKLFNYTINQLVKKELRDLKTIFQEEIKKNIKQKTLKEKTITVILKEMIKRISPLIEVGLDYLTMDRPVTSLSGGETQRIRLATQLNSGLSDVIYVLDEPSIGLHSRDTKKLIKTLRKLQRAGNSIIIVEHDKEIIKEADYLIDIGPGAGQHGGKVVFAGTIKALKKSKTETAQYLKSNFGVIDIKKETNKKKKRNKRKEEYIIIEGAQEHNLKNIKVKIPRRKLVTIAGVSGSGKSSLIKNVLAENLRKKIHHYQGKTGACKKISGVNKINKLVMINQAPIGKTPRSNAATYTGVFAHIRKLFAQTKEAKKKNLLANHFSFNMKGGRCEYCQGEGVQKIEMQLLNNVYAVCPHCLGTRYNKKIIEIEYHGVNIAQVLDMEIDYAYHFFNSCKLIKRKLAILKKVGLGYLRLGQSATELSGGEAQRIKLATELARKSKGETLYILDEPTIGLHFSDVKNLMKVLNQLKKEEHSVIIIEHNLDVITGSDWVIELGPEGGKLGGEVIFEGIPQDLKKAKTWTGKALKA